MEMIPIIIGFGGIVSALFAWVPVARFIGDTRKDMRKNDIAEGERRQIILTMQHDIELCQGQINGLDTRLVAVEAITVEVRNDLKHLVKTVDQIAQKVNA
jgi:hypothetical protein